jgi:hypothetical protein
MSGDTSSDHRAITRAALVSAPFTYFWRFS